MVPMAAAAATEEPLRAAKQAHAAMVAIPSPPGNFLNHLSKDPYSLAVMPAPPANAPIKMNRGMIV